MKNLFLVCCVLLFLSCNNEPTLQRYFVDNADNKLFTAVDISPSILNTNKIALTDSQKEALKSFEKVNVLVFKSDSLNAKAYTHEITNLETILKKETYQELMKMGSNSTGVTMYFTGKDDAIDELIVFAKNKDKGFAVARVLGDNMSPTTAMNLLSIIQQSKMDTNVFKPLQEIMN
jgi:hypothetical protein